MNWRSWLKKWELDSLKINAQIVEVDLTGVEDLTYLEDTE